LTRTQLILYVENQERSKDFYTRVLGSEPLLHVPGMTEFQLQEGCVLGLMPESGIKRLLDRLPDPALARGIPRSELYLRRTDARLLLERALANGASELSSFALRDWGEQVGYCLDPDGHVLAFAETS
jgi:uncharacterized protein